ncbi:hypothetical protein ABPG75_006609 [Micractinium tetrahymenae]
MAMMAAPAVAFKPQTRALVDALLVSDTEAALELLQGPGAAHLTLAGPAGFCSLHAAVAGRCHEALAPLAAAGAPLDSYLVASLLFRTWDDNQPSVLEQLEPVVSQAGLAALDERCKGLENFATPGLTPLALALLALLLRAGANCLQRWPPVWGSCAIRCALTALGGPLLAHLERQRAAGTLQLGKQEAKAPLLGDMQAGHGPLLGHALRRLEQLMLAGNAGSELEQADSMLLGSTLHGVLALPAKQAVPALQALLASPLPFVASALAHVQCQLLGRAAAHSRAVRKAALPLLHVAGCALTLESLLVSLQERSPAGLAALLALGTPPADTSTSCAVGSARYSCPVHELLRLSTHQYRPSRAAHDRGEAVRMLELLLAAGYRPTTYRDVAPLPFLGAQGWGSHVLPVFDPYDAHPASLDERLVFLACGGTWTPATHYRWPDASKPPPAPCCWRAALRGRAWQPRQRQVAAASGGGVGLGQQRLVRGPGAVGWRRCLQGRCCTYWSCRPCP